MNRDEQRARPIAWPPSLRTFGSTAALMPTDPPSGGTWIAVNQHGVLFALLNRTFAASHGQRGSAAGEAPGRSRGTVIPALAGAESLDAALALAHALGHEELASFRLILAGQGVVFEVIHEHGLPRLGLKVRALDEPLMWGSSGLGDELVEGPRQVLFEEVRTREPDEWPAAQDAFHGHQWPDRAHVSVRMERADARTVSRTSVTVRAGYATMAYEAANAGVFEAAPLNRIELRSSAWAAPVVSARRAASSA